MFLSHSVDVELAGNNELILCFRSLHAHIDMLRPPRARWRPQMIAPTNLRAVRSTVLGHMPGWCPPVHIVGPWRDIELVRRIALDFEDVEITSELTVSGQGILRAQLRTSRSIADGAILECANRRSQMTLSSDGFFRGELIIDEVAPWWPHTHGQPTLHATRVRVGANTIELGRIGFRRIEIDRGVDGRDFVVKINGERIFCRGACWSSADIVGLSHSRAAYEPWLQAMRDANMNMVRVAGTMVYEANAFYELCDELGLLVWQDFMFANFDYPIADANFERNVHEEAAQFLKRTSGSPSLVILCGGSEVSQQAAMLGLKREYWSNALFDEWLPNAVARLRPDVPYVSNSPHGGDLPFVANAGVTHYYGVGAYMRPFDDSRRAEVRFASECLAFANVPEQSTLTSTLPVAAVHHPQWKQRVPRDHGASWDFEDVRDHYFEYLYGMDPALLRREDAQRYLALSRAVTGEVMETVYAEWRRKGSTCNGGLVWYFQDLWPGAGWGVIDSIGEPKAAWYALRRAFRPVQLVLTDEGINGLALHAINETDAPHTAKLNLTCWNDATTVLRGERELTLPPRGAVQLSATEIFGVFFDVTYAYRFGPPGHSLVTATLSDRSGALIADAFYFPHGRDARARPFDMNITVEHRASEWTLCLQSDQLALSVHIDDECFRPEDNWFHLAPKTTRRVRLLPRSEQSHAPQGEVTALNGRRSYRYGSGR
jgi:beta-mannosidase